MHAANVKTSTRLQRTLALLGDKCWHDTREVTLQANVMAAHSAIAELRANGYTIDCRKRGEVFEYRLVSNFAALVQGAASAGTGVAYDDPVPAEPPDPELTQRMARDLPAPVVVSVEAPPCQVELFAFRRRYDGQEVTDQ